MRITVTSTFLHGTDRFEEGKKYDVDDAFAGYVIGNGWATGPRGANTVTRKGVVHDLQPDDGIHDLSSNQED